MALPENRRGVQALLKELGPRILGKEPQGPSKCREVHGAGAIAEKIEPGGDSYPGQEVNWALWLVYIKDRTGSRWCCGLSSFVKADELEAMFARHFGGQEIVMPYMLKVSDEDRVHANLPAAVRIRENDDQIRFCIDWGREQGVARTFHRYSLSEGCVPRSSKDYMKLLLALASLRPEIYRGGPDPELSYESMWHLDYLEALERAGTASCIHLRNVGKSSYRGTVYTNIDVVFAKNPC